MLKIQLDSADSSLEHTEFRVDFEAIRKDTMQSSGKVMGVPLRYNTPPVASTPVGGVWEADRTSGILYWAYDDSITEEKDPNCAKWFSIGGTRHPVADCKVPGVQVDGLSVFQFKTNYGSISVAAVDSEGVSSSLLSSGQTVPPATYVIKYDGNGATGGAAPASQSKTQYTDLATNKEFFTVKDGNKVTIINGTVAVTGGFSTSSTSDKFFLFSVKTGSTLNLSGCTLTGTNFWNAGGTAVEVSDGGSLTLANTTISNFESNSTGAGVYVSGGGSAIMNSGAIKNNKARYGAAVYLAGSFTMNGGEISGNTNVNGSSISRSGTFEWNGGTISNNTNGAADGGSVFASGINYGGTKSKNDAS